MVNPFSPSEVATLEKIRDLKLYGMFEKQRDGVAPVPGMHSVQEIIDGIDPFRPYDA